MMRYLIAFLLVLVLVWRWVTTGKKLQHAKSEKPKKFARIRQPIAVVSCLQCGVHVPLNEAVTGAAGTYCSVEHKQEHERTQ